MLKIILGLAVAFQAVSASIAEIGRNKRSTAGSDPVADLHKTPDIIAYWNYTVLTYTVETPDKYLLTLFRIPYGKSNASDSCQSREPIILHHGLFSSSADWVSQDATNNLPMILAENCFDVWLANARGTSYSNKHKNLNSSTDEAYWQFSFDEMGKYDVPTIIDFVLNNSNNTVQGIKFEKVSWVGHSLGCTSFFIGLHYNPEYNGKVRKMVALAPAAFIQGMQSPPAVALANVPDPLTEVFFIATTKGSFFPEIANSFIYNYAPNFCPEDPTGVLCASILNFITGSSLTSSPPKG